MSNEKGKKGETSIILTPLGAYFGALFETPLGPHSAQIKSPDSFLDEVVKLEGVTLRHSIEEGHVDILFRESRLYRLFTNQRDDGTYSIRYHIFSVILHNVGGIEDIIDNYKVTD